MSVPFGTDTLPTGTPPAVLETKLVTRRRLPEQMIQASDPITKINTPSGFGKTILLSQCAAALAHAIAWVSLDDVDDDPTVLLTEIATAVDRIASVDPAIFVHLPSPEPAIGAEVVPRQLTSLAQAPQRALLLDDVHLVRGAPSARALALLGEHLTATVRVILATLGRLNALPCDPVLERADSAETLADYRRECCRYCDLCSKMLRADLARVESGIEGQQHLRASRWHALHGDAAEAIKDSLVGRVRHRATDLLAKNIRARFNSGRQATIRRWLEAFSDADLVGCPPRRAVAASVMSLLCEAQATAALYGDPRRGLVCRDTAARRKLDAGSGSPTQAGARVGAGVNQMWLQAELAYRSEPPGNQAVSRCRVCGRQSQAAWAPGSGVLVTGGGRKPRLACSRYGDVRRWRSRNSRPAAG